MALRKVDVVGCELEDELDQNGFRHRETVMGPALDAERIGGTVYEADAGIPIWPYHYHYGVEEWLYVVTGTPVLRDPGGRRDLLAGDLVCFPSGHLGAHTLEGPGRFLMFSTQVGLPVMSVYPDSDKLSVAPTRWGGEPYDRIIVPRDAGVDYWYGEGDGGRRERRDVVRQPDSAPGPPVVNVLAGDGGTSGPLLHAVARAIAPGEAAAAYRYEFGREEWVVVLDGTVAVRHPGGEDQLVAGEAACFVAGPAGARQLVNRGERAARVLLLSTTGVPANICYPDSGTWVMRNTPDGEGVLVAPPRAEPSEV